MELNRVWRAALERYPENLAVVDGTRRYTYSEWGERINRLAYGLQGLGLSKGDHVLVLLKNREETASLFWACQLLGLIDTPLNFRFSVEEYVYCAKDSGAKAIVFEEVSREIVEEGRKRLGDNIHYIFVGEATPPDSWAWEILIEQANDQPKFPDIFEDDISMMLYTSGTTGRPKGVPRSHKQDYSAAAAHIIQNHYSLGERTLGVMPLYHTMGCRSLTTMGMLNGLWAALSDYSSDQALQLIQDESLTAIYLIPTLYHDILNHPDFGHYNLNSLKKIGYAGAPMTSSLTHKCEEKLKPEVFVNHYGSTEVYTFSICERLKEKPGCAGRPGVHGRMRVVKADPDRLVGPDEVVPVGERGELIVSMDTPEAFDGYWNRPDANAKAIRQGWYFTGDVGYMDKDGDFWVVGRLDDMIISGGENIQPVEVEDVLAQHPKVSEVAVVGLPDERWGEIVAAFIVPQDPSLTAEELDRYCVDSSQMANFKRPRKFVFIKQLPKSSVGKILRRKLREGAYEELAVS